MQRKSMISLLCILAFTITLGAQTKKPASFADYGKWEALAPAAGNGGLSPDGSWIVYAINRSNGENELRILDLARGGKKVAPFGAQPAFSSDSKWLSYSIGQSEEEREKLRREQKPIQNKLELLNLATGETATFDGIESFAFSSDGAYLAMKRYGPERPSGSTEQARPAPRGRGGRVRSEADEEAPGTTLIVRRLADGRDTSFGNVSQYSWQNSENTHLLAMIISAEGKTGNGVHLFDPESSTIRVLDSSASIYTRLTWRKDAPDLAALRARTHEQKEGSCYDVLAWTGLGQAENRREYAPEADSDFPAGMRTVSYRPLSWSDDGKVLFLGVAEWKEKIGQAEGESGGGRARRGRGASSNDADISTIEIWHADDVFVMPRQKLSAAADRQRNMLAAWHLESGKLVQLGKDPVNEQVNPIGHTDLAWAAEWSKYAFNRTIGRPAADLYLVDVSTGSRTKIKEGINDRYVQVGLAGKYLIFRDGDDFCTLDLATRKVVNVSKSLPTSFVDKESDQTSPQKPSFGIAGWTKDDAAVLFYDKYDLWRVPSDGSRAQRLTDGAAEKVRYRMANLEGGRGRYRRFTAPAEEPIDLGKPLYMSVYGEWTKKYGYARLEPEGGVTRLIWLDKNVGSLAKAKDAETYAYIVQDYDDSPDIFVGGADLSQDRQVTATNPFQSDYAWGRSELLEYTSDKGRRLQGALFYPAGYEQGKKYPMIVYNYELLSQNVHNYVVPSDRSYYNLSVFTSHGYFVLEPDIVFRPRQPGRSVVECITAGVKKAIETGMIDPARVGIVGHSMGGYNTSFVATHTQGIFAAAVAGAAMTDLVSYYGDHHWSSGIAETDHIETGQERMVVPLYEDLQAYIDNSAYFNAHNMTVPLMLEVGDSDGTVAWHQGIELYNLARRARKNVVMLAYMGEDHGLRRKANQKDYQQRILAWFGHYLKGEPAEPWITRGKSYLEREEEIKRQKAKKSS